MTTLRIFFFLISQIKWLHQFFFVFNSASTDWESMSNYLFDFSFVANIQIVKCIKFVLLYIFDPSGFQRSLAAKIKNAIFFFSSSFLNERTNPVSGNIKEMVFFYFDYFKKKRNISYSHYSITILALDMKETNEWTKL